MEIIRINIHDKIKQSDPICACIGYFDGIHVGHQALIKETIKQAHEKQAIPALITFDPDPWIVLKMLKDIPHITPMKKRIEIAKQYGIEKVIILEFEKDMSKLSYEDFHELLLQPLNVKALVCGYDFSYAFKGSGNVDTLRKQSYFDVIVVAQISKHHQKISSTLIEKSIVSGDMEMCYDLLGRYYEIDGIIIKGNQIGRKYGYPTANLKLADLYLIPKRGVYIGMVKYDNKNYPAIINIGHNPSFNYQNQTSIEAYILDFNKNIYSQEVSFVFNKFIREEKCFKGMEELKIELEKNEKQARAYFAMRKELL